MSSLTPFHSMPAQDVLRALGSRTSGLSSREVQERMADARQYRLPPPKPTAVWKVFGRQFLSPFVYVLLVASLIAWFSGEMLDASVTLGIVVVNAVLGFIQELQADRAFFALATYIPRTVSVRRDGVACSVSADDVVRGDVMLIRAGQRIVADGRILSSNGLSVSEAALSGESEPREKSGDAVLADADVFDRRSMVYAGTSVMTGDAVVVVTALGTQTEFGKIGVMTAQVENRESPLTVEVRALTRWLTVLILCLALGIFLFTFLRGVSVMLSLSLAAALAIAIIPEGLPMTLTVLLSAAMRRMLRKGVLVRHMAATETLGCVQVLCVDKTGTLTSGEMTLSAVRTPQGDIAPSSCASSDIGLGLWAFAHAHRTAASGPFAGAATAEALSRFVTWSVKESCEATVPFSSTYRFSACRTRSAGTFVLGAPDVLLERAGSMNDRVAYSRLVEDMAQSGLRVVLLGKSETSGALTPGGIDRVDVLCAIGIEDPLRESVPGALAQAEAAGIRTIMMTGDHPDTARVIAQKARDGRAAAVMLGKEFAALSVQEQLRALESVTVFARMLPEHKLLVVNALHAKGLRVAMTGDGVNDAPALKAADIGIAVGHATEVAKEASDIVLLDGDFGSIVSAIVLGRNVFSHARNVTVFLLALGLVEMFCIIGSMVFGLPLPLTPLLILWLNIVTDGIPGLFFAFEDADISVMHDIPRDTRDGLISPFVRQYIGYTSLLLLLVVLCAEAIAAMVRIPVNDLRTVTYMSIGLLGVCFAFVMRSLRKTWIQNLASHSPVIWGAFLGMLVLIVPLAIPLSREHFGLAWPDVRVAAGIVVGILLLISLLDFVKRRSFSHR